MASQSTNMEFLRRYQPEGLLRLVRHLIDLSRWELSHRGKAFLERALSVWKNGVPTTSNTRARILNESWGQLIHRLSNQMVRIVTILRMESLRGEVDFQRKRLQAKHQQCLAHLLRRANSLIEQACGRALVFPRAVKSLLQEGLSARDRAYSGMMTWHGASTIAGRLKSQLQRLTETMKSNIQHERFAKFSHNHLDSIFKFLQITGTDATNWRGEQAIRPAVVNRKV